MASALLDAPVPLPCLRVGDMAGPPPADDRFCLALGVLASSDRLVRTIRGSGSSFGCLADCLVLPSTRGLRRPVEV